MRTLLALGLIAVAFGFTAWLLWVEDSYESNRGQDLQMADSAIERQSTDALVDAGQAPVAAHDRRDSATKKNAEQLAAPEAQIDTDAAKAPGSIRDALESRNVYLYDAAGMPLSEPAMIEIAKSIAIRDLRSNVGNEAFFTRVDELLAHEEHDQDWAVGASRTLQDELPVGPEFHSYSECLTTVCFVDIEMPSSQFARQIAPRLQEWSLSAAPGFLPVVISQPVEGSLRRLVFFRDSFDPTEIGAKPIF